MNLLTDGFSIESIKLRYMYPRHAILTTEVPMDWSNENTLNFTFYLMNE